MRYGRLGLLALLLLAAAPAWAQSLGSPGGGGFNLRRIHNHYVGEAGGVCRPQTGAVVGLDAAECNSYAIVLGGNWQLSNPIGLLAGQAQSFEIAQPASGGPWFPTFGSAFSFTAGAPAACAVAGQTNCISTAAGNVDYIPCTGSILQPGRLICGSIITNALGISAPTVSNLAVNTCAAATTCASGSYNVVAGHAYVLFADTCPNANCTTGGTQTISTIVGSANIGTCAVAAGARSTASLPIKAEGWLCPATGSGSTVFTVTWSASVSFTDLRIMDIAGAAASPDDGVGNFNSCASSCTTAGTVSSNGNTTQDNELLLAFAFPNNSGLEVPGTGYVFAPGSAAGGTLVEQSTVNTHGAQTAGMTLGNNGTGAWAMVFVPIKHP